MDLRFPLRTLIEFNTRQFHAAIDGIDDHRASRTLGTSRLASTISLQRRELGLPAIVYPDVGG
jgi:hypothetical protein